MKRRTLLSALLLSSAIIGCSGSKKQSLGSKVEDNDNDNDNGIDNESEDEFIIELINPEIIESEGEQTGPEGCLSVPGACGIVTRPERVKVRAQDRYGNTFEVEGTGLTARAFCHEIDHLDGKLYTEIAERMMDPEEIAAMNSVGDDYDEDFDEEFDEDYDESEEN